MPDQASRTVPDKGSPTHAPRQLTLPFLTADDAATLDAARVAIERACAAAIAARRVLDAAELARIGAELVEILDRNAAANRQARH